MISSRKTLKSIQTVIGELVNIDFQKISVFPEIDTRSEIRNWMETLKFWPFRDGRMSVKSLSAEAKG
jgi:hypothetical protein